MQSVQSYRKIRPNVRSVTGIYITRTGKPLEFESQLERDSYLVLDFEPDIGDITAQPLRISNWVPDCLITSQGRKVLVEMKYERELVAKWSELSERYSFLSKEVTKDGFDFRVMTDCSVYYPETHRVDLLKSIKAHRGSKHVPERIRDQINEVLRTEGQSAVGKLIQGIDPDSDYASRIGMMCKLLCSGQPYFLKTPTARLLDCLISIPKTGVSSYGQRMFDFNELRERIRAHPIHGLERGSARAIA